MSITQDSLELVKMLKVVSAENTERKAYDRADV